MTVNISFRIGIGEANESRAFSGNIVKMIDLCFEFTSEILSYNPI